MARMNSRGTNGRASTALLGILVCLIFGALDVEMADAQRREPRERTPARFVLSSDMVDFAAPSSRFFLGWLATVSSLAQVSLDATSSLFELDRSDRFLPRLGVAVLFGGASVVVDRAFSLTAHDAAHVEAARSIGATYVALVTPDTQTEMSVWEFLLGAFNPASEPGLYLYSKPGLTLREQAYVAGAGLNMNLLIASNVAAKVVRGEAHLADLSPYLLNKLWPVGYFLDAGPYSDAASYLTLFGAQGYEAPAGEVVSLLAAGSCLASGAFLSLTAAAWEFLANGDMSAKPLAAQLGPMTIFWPEVTPWLNSDNVSLQVLLTAAIGASVLAEAGVDRPVWGNRGAPSEFTLGARLRVAPLEVGTEVTSGFNGFPLLVGRAEFALNRALSVGVKGFYGRGDTMRELREYPLGPGATTYLKATF